MTKKRASHFREKKRKFFAGVASRVANWARVGGGGATASSFANRGPSAKGRAFGAAKREKNARGRRRKGRRVVVWSVFFAGAALTFGAADRGASQCFWRRWREARRAPSVRTFYAPTVVGFAPSSSVWAVPRPIAVARPVASPPVVASFPSVPFASPPVVASCASPSEPTFAEPSFAASSVSASNAIASASVATSVAYPPSSEEVCFSNDGTVGNGADDAVCSSNVCAPCAATASACVETEYEEEEITTYETVWDCETRYRDKTITRRVPETSIKREKVRVERPVWETVEKETTYDVTRYVPETTMQTRTRTVLRPVVQMRERKIVETVNRPVVETVMTQRRYVVNRPTTTYRTETRDYGGYETQITAIPGREKCCLRWRCGGDYYDPTTGKTRYRLPGLYWTPTKEPTEYRVQKVYRPNLVETQTPVTVYVPETVVENAPTTRTTFRPELVERTVREPTTAYVRETQTEETPVTTYKPVKERVVKKTPTRVLRTQTTEEIRETPITTYKTITEVVKEPYVARVARLVPKKTKRLRPVPVYKTVVPVSTRYATEDATTNGTTVESVETFETFETLPTETSAANVEKNERRGPEGTVETDWDAAAVAPRLTGKTVGAVETVETVETTESARDETARFDGTEETEVAQNQRKWNDGAKPSGPDLPSAVPNVRRAARPNANAAEKTPPVVSPSSETASANRERAASANLPLPTVAPTRTSDERR